jgi:ABC-2 type transport system ATP-binding protein
LARALLHEPKVLILDEPTGAVDPVAAHALLELIIEIVEKNRIAALISSHRLEEIEALHSHVILLDRGSVRYDGDLDDLRRRYDRARVELEFTDHNSAIQAELTLKRTKKVEASEIEATTLVVTLAPGVSIAEIFEGLGRESERLSHIRDSRTPLRDVLAALYRESAD